MKKIFLSLFLLVSLEFNPVWAAAPNTEVINSESSTFKLQIKYPQGFADKNIDAYVKNFIKDIQQANTAVKEADLAVKPAPGKSSLLVDYKIQFQTQQALSLMFMISTYSRGAAHPNNTIRTLNFIDGKPVNLDQLFKVNSDYLPQLASMATAVLLNKKISDKDWIAAGTKPTTDNYRNWYFQADGLALVFDTYQVAAYFQGPQTINIPLAKLSTLLSADVMKAVWGNE